MSSREGRAQDEGDGGKLPVASRSRMSSEGAAFARATSTLSAGGEHLCRVRKEVRGWLQVLRV